MKSENIFRNIMSRIPSRITWAFLLFIIALFINYMK